jgi:hypothetical protein
MLAGVGRVGDLHVVDEHAGAVGAVVVDLDPVEIDAGRSPRDRQLLPYTLTCWPARTVSGSVLKVRAQAADTGEASGASAAGPVPLGLGPVVRTAAPHRRSIISTSTMLSK